MLVVTAKAELEASAGGSSDKKSRKVRASVLANSFLATFANPLLV